MDKVFDNPNLDELALREEWMSEARQMTPEKLTNFVQRLILHPHDYGTICRGIAAAGVAAAYAVEHSPAGGITGFQASCVLWDLITGWNDLLHGKPLRLVDYEDLLFPQYEEKFRSITRDTWEHVRGKAKTMLGEKESVMSSAVRTHLQSIVDGHVPFGLEVRG